MPHCAPTAAAASVTVVPTDHSPAVAHDVRLRPYQPGDLLFLQALYATTRVREMALAPWPEQQKTAFLRQQLTAREAHYAAAHPHAANDIVVVGGRDAGRLMVDRTGGQVLVVDVALLPAFRSRGIGTALMMRVLADAAELGLPVRLHADPDGDARRLYLRLGFTSVSSDGVRELMELLP
jgi:GNAT superfamily N-acetyltransferase